MKKKILFLVSLSTLVLILTGCAAKNEPVAPVAAQPKSLIAEGRLYPINYLDHNFTISGYVDQVLVENDQMVKKDQVLATLVKSPDASLALARAEEELIAAQFALDQLSENAALTLATAQLDLTVA